jgi:ComF family protein
MLKNWKEWKAWNLLYPRKCAICDCVLSKKEQDICRACKKRVFIIDNNICLTCGKPIKEGETYCKDCRSRKHYFAWGVACYRYCDVRDAIYRMKYAGREDIISYFSTQIAQHLKINLLQMHADCFIPIPMHRSRERKRGYNQATLLARELSLRLGIPILENAVIRRKKTIPMKYLSVKQRQLNLKKAFIIGKNDVKLKTIILVDDIYTTGSTMDCVAKVLLEAGAKEIYFVVVAIGKQTDK